MAGRLTAGEEMRFARWRPAGLHTVNYRGARFTGARPWGWCTGGRFCGSGGIGITVG